MSYYLHGNILVGNILANSVNGNLFVNGNLDLADIVTNANILSNITLTSNIVDPGTVPTGNTTLLKTYSINFDLPLGTPSLTVSTPIRIVGIEGTVQITPVTKVPLADGYAAGSETYSVSVFPSRTLITIARTPGAVLNTINAIIYGY